MIPTEPGIYHDLPFEDYCRVDAFNSGLLKEAVLPNDQLSMLHLKAAIDGKVPDSDSTALKFGRAIHCRLLEPERYHDEVLISTPCQATNGRGEVCGANGKLFDPVSHQWFCGVRGHAPPGSFAPKEYVSASEAEDIECMATSLHNHEVMQLFKCSGWSEMSVIFEHSGVKLKGRLDKFTAEGPKFSDGRPLILDIKKGQRKKIDRRSCQRKILDYLWYMQAAIYVDAMEYHGHKDADFVWVFIEDGPPYDVNIIPASSVDIQIGRDTYRKILSQYATAQKQEKYHGYIYWLNAIERGALPQWVVDQWERSHKQGDNGADYEPVSGTVSDTF